MRAIFLVFTFILNFYGAIGQSVLPEFGARSKGMGNSNSTFTDESSIFNNVGGISGVNNGMVFFGYDKYTGVEGFDRIAVAAIHPLSFGNIGASLYSFGDNLYSESTASLAYGNKIGFVRLGAKINYYQLRIDEFGTASAFYIDFGGVVELIPKLTFGAYISNFTLAKLNNAEMNELPVLMKLGFSYKPIEKINLNLDIYKDIEYDPVIRAGLEYILVKKFFLRTGVNSNPFRSYFGIGLLLKRFQFDYALSNHDFLGLSHQVNISFRYFNKNEG